ncbi:MULTISPECIES: hypothetical protein [unclassified Pseudoalteromonas]|uniref:hypothetical protein n=1 Tax=unclassified Pseudoalteromonas TaxID=194690 RepID=UPI00332EA9CB
MKVKQEVADKRDVREILINNANIRLSLMGVKSLLAYQIFLFFIFIQTKDSLSTKGRIHLVFDSLDQLSEELAEYSFFANKNNRSSIKTALNALEKAGLIMSTSNKLTKEEMKFYELQRRSVLVLYLDIENLLDWRPTVQLKDELEYACGEERFMEWKNKKFLGSNQNRTLIFDNYLLPIIKFLNFYISDKKITLLAYQIALYFIFQLKEEDFGNLKGGGKIKFIFDTYCGFLQDILPFISIFDISEDTVSDNLNTLHNLGLMRVASVDPEEDDDCIDYRNSRSCLTIELFFDEDHQLTLSTEFEH